MVFDIWQLAKDIKNKRLIEDKSLRVVSKEIGVSFATISRIENLQIPDIKTFGLLLTWLIADANRYFKKKSS